MGRLYASTLDYQVAQARGDVAASVGDEPAPIDTSDFHLRSDYDRQLTIAARKQAAAVDHALATGQDESDVRKYTGLLSARDREKLRAIVRREHSAMFGENISNAEVDKFIDSWAESMIYKQLAR